MESATALILTYRYWILIPLSFVEGPIIAFITGTLSWLGYFDPYIAFAVFFFRDVILDTFMYYLGRYGGQTTFAKRILHKVGVEGAHLEEVRLLWERHGFRTMFFAKLSYGLSAAFLIVAGIVGMSYRRFLGYAALVALAQYGLLFILGYFFGNLLPTVANVLALVQYVIGGGLLAASIYYLFSRYMRRKLTEEERNARSE